MITIDTNVLIYYLGGDIEVVQRVDQWRQEFGFLITSLVVQIELLSYSSLTENDMQAIAEILSTMHVVGVDMAVATIASSLRRSYKLKLADAIVAATALHTGTSLVTRNIHDFKKVSELDLIKI